MMKYIIIGLGKLGKAMAESFTQAGNEVIGVDANMHEVDAVKQLIATAICMDTKDMNALNTLPLKEADAVFVTYGEDFGLSVQTAAIIKQLGTNKLIVRAISPLHETVLTAIGVSEILSPEKNYANKYAAGLLLGKKLDHWYKITPTHHVVQIHIPEALVGRMINDVDFESDFNLKLIGTLRLEDKKNIFGITEQKWDLLDPTEEDSVFQEGDLLIVFGKSENYSKLADL